MAIAYSVPMGMVGPRFDDLGYAAIRVNIIERLKVPHVYDRSFVLLL